MEQEQEFEITDMMNHHPAYPGIWVPYNGWRLKDRYDIKLKTGEVWEYYYPNGGSFSKIGKHDGPYRVEDDEIAEIRLVPDEELWEEYWFSGKERLDRNMRYFGGAVPKVEVAEDGTVTFIPRQQRHFKEHVYSSWDGEFTYRLGLDELSIEELMTALATNETFEYGSNEFVAIKRAIDRLAGNAKLEGVVTLSSGEDFIISTPEAYPCSVLRMAFIEIGKMARDQIQKDREIAAEEARRARLGFTPTGKSARRQIAVSALAAHMTSTQLSKAIDRKVPGGGKNVKDGCYVTKSEMRLVDGVKLTGKQLRKMQKKMRQAERDKVASDGTE
jgi:hypothetical protein